MSAQDDAAWAAALFAVDPAGLGGVCLRSLMQPARTRWLEILRELLPAALPMRRIPFNIGDARLLGGLDVSASLAANRPIAEHGVLAAAHEGVVVLCMAERLSSHTAACLAAVLDSGAVTTQRDGVRICDPARVGVVAQDEGIDEERVPTTLLDRLAFLIDLSGYSLRTRLSPLHDAEQVREARRLLPQVRIEADLIAALCSTGVALGAGSLRVSLLAVRTARAIAALLGRRRVGTDDAVVAGRLVLAPRATRLPQEREPRDDEREPRNDEREPPAEAAAAPARDDQDLRPASPPSSPPPAEQEGETQPSGGESRRGCDEVVLAGTRAALPPGLLASLRGDTAARGRFAPGRAGVPLCGGDRGRPAGEHAGMARGSRLNLVATLRAAAPWQPARGRGSAANGRLVIRPGDFRSTRFSQRSRTLTIFAVDASGSAAMHRLAEAKGAVEMLLAECYVRRDRVAVITFRGARAQVALPPTRSLVRAKRNLASMPGGGGTPLASAIRCAALLAQHAQRGGETPLVVLLTDGRANVALDGRGGRETALAEAFQAARGMRGLHIAALFIDTSPSPNAAAAELASAMRADYLPLPSADARALSGAVSAAIARAGSQGAAP